MPPKPERAEVPEAARRFDALVRKVLSVSREEILRREAEYKRQSDLNPIKRGVKPGVLNHKPKASKPKPSA